MRAIFLFFGPMQDADYISKKTLIAHQIRLISLESVYDR